LHVQVCDNCTQNVLPYLNNSHLKSLKLYKGILMLVVAQLENTEFSDKGEFGTCIPEVSATVST
jgi:hypothetical protein